MPAATFPCNFTVTMPNPLPPVSGFYAGTHGFFTFVAGIYHDDGRYGQLLWDINLTDSTPTTGGTFSPGAFAGGVLFTFATTWSASGVVYSITAPEAGWHFNGVGNCRLEVIGNDVSPWNLRTFESNITIASTGATEPLSHPPGGEGPWDYGAGPVLVYFGYFTLTDGSILPISVDPTNAQRYGIILRGDTGIWRVTSVTGSVMQLDVYELPQHNIRETSN